jgi:hypothetical protein
LIYSAFAWAPLFRKEYQLLTWSAVFKNSNIKPSSALSFLQTNIPLLILSIMLIVGLVKSIPATQRQIAKSKPYDLYQNASIWLEENTQANERIFQTDWDDFPRLFFYNTYNTYLIGLDPTYMQFYNEELYQSWVRITRGEIEKPSILIANLFSADYVLTDLKHQDFINQAKSDSGLKEVYRDAQAIIYLVRP